MVRGFHKRTKRHIAEVEMKRITLFFVVAAMLCASCAGLPNKRMSSAQQAAGALIITGAVAGGAYAGSVIAVNNNASDITAIASGAAGAVVCGMAAGYLYNAVLDIFNFKEELPVVDKDVNREETPDFMLQKR
jgi:hypothetical protein